MSGSRHDWLDDETAERLLSGEPVDAGNTGTTGKGGFGSNESRKQRDRRLDALTDLLSAASAVADASVEPERENAALAAFRQVRADVGADAFARADVAAGPAVAPDVVVVGDGRAVVVAAGGRFGRLRGWPGSAKVALAAVVAATALASGVTAAAVGVIPSPFTGGGFDLGPRHPGHRPSTDATESPQMSEPAGSASSTPTRSGAGNGQGTPSPSSPSASPGGGPGPNGTFGGDDPDALCHDYLTAENGHGKGVRPDTMKWLVAEAGGARSVDSYCRQRLGKTEKNGSSGHSIIKNGGLGRGNGVCCPVTRDSLVGQGPSGDAVSGDAAPSAMAPSVGTPSPGASSGPNGGGSSGGGSNGTGSGASGSSGGATAPGAGVASPGTGSAPASGPGASGAASGSGGGAGDGTGHGSGSGSGGSGSNGSGSNGSDGQGPCGDGAGGDGGFGRHTGDHGPGHDHGGLLHLPYVPYVAAIGCPPAAGLRPLAPANPA